MKKSSRFPTPLVMPEHKVALLGRPNVGKSTLFNRLIRSNRAITHDRPGITRDRMEGVVRSWGQAPFGLIDTGGVTLDYHAHVAEGPEGIRGFEAAILSQAEAAVSEATLLCLVVDARDGLTPFDQHLANFLRKKNKPVFLVVNKVDGPEKTDILTAEFAGLGFDLIACSAEHGYNIRTLEEELRFRLFDALPLVEPAEEPTLEDIEPECLPITEEIFLLDGEDTIEILAGTSSIQVEIPEDLILAEPLVAGPDAAPDIDPALLEPSQPLRLALLGRPNAGKSSLVNAMIGQARMIVSDTAGTTRDSVDVAGVVDGEPCVFVDTAGVRRRSRITDTVERYSVNSSLKSTTKAHVTLLVLDVTEGFTQQDKRLIDLLHERKTPFMVIVNKCDNLSNQEQKSVEKDCKEALCFCPHVPLLFISALKRRNLKRILPLARAIRHECGVRIPTGQINRAMDSLLERHQPPLVKGVRAKFFYLTQAEIAPPTFVFFVNNADRVLASYARYLEKALRTTFGILHAPMRVHFRSSHKKKVRK